MNDKQYVDGLEAGVTLVKAIFALPAYERKAVFGTSDVATILDRFNFAELNEKMSGLCET